MEGGESIDWDDWSWCWKARGRQDVEIIRCKNQPALVNNTVRREELKRDLSKQICRHYARHSETVLIDPVKRSKTKRPAFYMLCYIKKFQFTSFPPFLKSDELGIQADGLLLELTVGLKKPAVSTLCDDRERPVEQSGGWEVFWRALVQELLEQVPCKLKPEAYKKKIR